MEVGRRILRYTGATELVGELVQELKVLAVLQAAAAGNNHAGRTEVRLLGILAAAPVSGGKEKGKRSAARYLHSRRDKLDVRSALRQLEVNGLDRGIAASLGFRERGATDRHQLPVT